MTIAGPACSSFQQHAMKINKDRNALHVALVSIWCGRNVMSDQKNFVCSLKVNQAKDDSGK